MNKELFYLFHFEKTFFLSAYEYSVKFIIREQALAELTPQGFGGGGYAPNCSVQKFSKYVKTLGGDEGLCAVDRWIAGGTCHYRSCASNSHGSGLFRGFGDDGLGGSLNRRAQPSRSRFVGGSNRARCLLASLLYNGLNRCRRDRGGSVSLRSN